MKNIILFGAPGAGKGTQSAQIVENWNLVHLSTGDLFRTALKNQTPIGLKAKTFLDQGLLVPDEVVIQMIQEALDERPLAPGFIFDGFPRTLAQAQALDELLKARNAPITAVVLLEVPDAELRERLKNRALVSGRSDDANPEVIEKRIQVYKEETYPLRDYYLDKGKLHQVVGLGTVEEIAGKIRNIIS